MTIDFSGYPYYDDYQPASNFHKILFIPGNAVQARELTQIQSILQEQVKRHGDFVFQNGTVVVPGHVFYDDQVQFLKLEMIYNGLNIEPYLQSLIGTTITGSTSGVQARVLSVQASDTTNPVTLYFKYTAGNGDVSTFANGELITEPTTGITAQVQVTTTYTGPTTLVSIGEGVFYVNGYFVGVSAQSISLDRFSNTPSYNVGLEVIEEVVKAVDDPTLFDNAAGFSNYAAPGADRYRITLNLAKRAIDYTDSSATDVKFIQLLQVLEGNIQYMYTDTKLAEIEKIFARRTYDESGDYIVNDFSFNPRHYRNNHRGAWVTGTVYLIGDVVTTTSGNLYYAKNDGISGATEPSVPYGIVSDGAINWVQSSDPYINNGVYTPTETTIALHKENEAKMLVSNSPGKAYISGFEVNVVEPRNTVVQKPRDTAQVTNTQLFAPSGSYAIVTGVAGAPLVTSIPLAQIKDGLNGTGTTIGTAWVKNMEIFSDPGYKIVMFGIQMHAGKDFQHNAVSITTSVGTPFTGNFAVQFNPLSGTVSSTSGSVTVTGVGTLFTSELKPGYRVLITNTQWTVLSIESDVSLTLAASASITLPNVQGYVVYSGLFNLGNFVQPLANSYVRSIRNSVGDIDTQYQITKMFTGQVASSGSITLTSAVSGELFVKEPKHIVVHTADNSIVTTAIASFTGVSITFVGLTTGQSYNILAVMTRTGTVAKEKIKTLLTKTITINSGSIYDSTYATPGTLISGTSSYSFSQPSISLTEADVTRIIKVTMSGDIVGNPYSATNEVDITQWYTFDNGQKPEYYDIGKLLLKRGQNTPQKPIRVTFEYFDHSDGDYFSVDSYSSVPYYTIPANLRDGLDFRSRISDSGADFSSTGASVSEPLWSNSTMTASYSYYLPRKDTMTLSKTGRFEYFTGTSAHDPLLPHVNDGSLSVANLTFDPYMLGPSNVQIDSIAHRRYTMDDIRKLEQRLANAEYYIALSELEKKTSSLLVYDANGLPRFKNGFLADGFNDTQLFDVTSSDIGASIDASNTLMRPLFNRDQIPLYEPDGTYESSRLSKNYKVTGKYITLPYTETPLISQMVASHGELINPFSVVTFVNPASGASNAAALTLIPAVDTWAVSAGGATSGYAGYTVGSDQNGIYQQTPTYGSPYLYGSSYSLPIVYPDMRARTVVAVIQGIKPLTTLHAFVDSTNMDILVHPCTIIKISLNGPTDKFITYLGGGWTSSTLAARTTANGSYDVLGGGEVIHSSNATAVVVQQETQSIGGVFEVVLFVTNVMSGYTSFAPGDVIKGDLSGTKATVVSVRAGTMATNSLGNWYGIIKFGDGTPSYTASAGWFGGGYTIPGHAFLPLKTGAKTIKFNDVADGNSLGATTEATAIYTATTTNAPPPQQITISGTAISYGMPTGFPSMSHFTTTITIPCNLDPLAQTFVVPAEYTDGCIVTSCDLFFAYVGVGETLPVIVQICEVENGYPTNNVLLNATSIVGADKFVISANSSVPVNFPFTGPVTLEPGKEYCIKVLSNSIKYKVWVSQMGENRVDLPQIPVSAQPSTGSLFKSQNNSVWTADQTMDLKFRLNRAKFDISRSGTITLTNPSISQTIGLPPNPFKITAGQNTVRVYHPNHGLTVGRTIVYTNVAATGMTYPSAADLMYTSGFVVTAVPNDDVYYFTITYAGSYTFSATDNVGGSAVQVDRSYKFSVLNLNIAAAKPSNTNLTYAGKFAGASSKDTTYTQITPNTEFELGAEKWVLSSLNENISLGGQRSLEVQINLSSTKDALSPILNLEGTYLNITNNRITNPSTADVNTAIDSLPVVAAATDVVFVVGTGGAGYFSSATKDFSHLTIGSYISISGTTSNNSIGLDTQVVDIDFTASPIKVYVGKTTVNESPASCTIVQYTTYVDEIAPVGGSAEAKYQHIPVVMEQLSTGLRIMFSSYVPNAADFDVYYRVAVQNSSFPLSSHKWVNANVTYKKSATGEFVDQEYDINNLNSFNTYQVKIVMLSTDSSQVPKFKDFRVIALA